MPVVADGPEFIVNSTSEAAQWNASIEVLADGRFVATWSSFDGPWTKIRAALSDADAGAVGVDFIVNSTADRSQQGGPTAALAGGGFVTVWQAFDEGAIRARVSDADGLPLGPDFIVNSIPGFHTNSAVAGLADGRFVAIWQDTNSGDDLIRARIFNADGRPSGSDFVADSTLAGRQFAPSVCALENGRFLAVWDSLDAGDGSGGCIRARLYNSDGSADGGDFIVNSTAGSDQFRSSATLLADGRFVAVWSSFDRGASPCVRARIFNSDGTPAAADFVVSSGQGHELVPALAALPDGRFVVAWQFQTFSNPNGTGDESGASIRARVFDADGNAEGADFLVNTTIAGDQSLASVAPLLDGRFVVSWTSAEPGDGSSSCIRAQVFDPRESGVSLNGNDSANDLTGTASVDALRANGGDDRLSGGLGGDVVDGGDGIDIAVWTSVRSQYDIRTLTSGTTKVIDRGDTGDGGVDTVTHIEFLEFPNHTARLAGGNLNHLSNISGERFDDVVFQNAGTGQVLYARMIDGVFQGWGVDTAPLGPDLRAVAVGDVNPAPVGGAETFVQRATDGAVYFASLDTGATAWSVVSTHLTADWKLRTVADVNGDAGVDVIVQNSTNGTIYYGVMAGGHLSEWKVVSAELTADWVAVGAGDINSDGYADVVVQQESTGTTYYANMVGGSFSGWKSVATVTADWKVRAVGDVDGDGFADVVFQDQLTGNAYYASMTNGVFDHWGAAALGTGPEWAVQGLADVDNDGSRDVLVQHGGSGTTYYASIGPSGFENWAMVATGITADWHVI